MLTNQKWRNAEKTPRGNDGKVTAEVSGQIRYADSENSKRGADNRKIETLTREELMQRVYDLQPGESVVLILEEERE